MSLKSLFVITLSVLLLSILSVVFVVNVKSMQEFVQNQVYSSSQDTVHSLSMSISTLKDKDSLEDIELMINAIFDSGYYEYINYYDDNNSLIFETSLPILIKDVPSWFIEYIPLELSEATSNVYSSWQKVGHVTLKGHAGYAYYRLYKEFENLLLVFAIISGISFVVLLFIINTLLLSLKRIRLQADGINEHKFIIEKSSPFVKEFDVLINAMNHMVKKVEGIFKSEVKTFEELQNLLYRDEETNLPNKKYFMLKLKEILEDESCNVGYLAIISIDGLTKIKHDKSYDVYKKVLDSFVSSIPKELISHNLLARINEGEMAVLFNTHNTRTIKSYFNSLQSALSITNNNISSKEKLFCYSVGVAPYFKHDELSEVLSRVDYALSKSQINGCNIVDIYLYDENAPKLVTEGKGSWKTVFENIFNEDRIALSMQSVIDSQSDMIFHDEVFVRIKENDGSLQTAGYYLPMANALGIVAKFDQHVISEVIERIDLFETPVAINISKDYVLQSVYFLELRNALSLLRISHKKKIHFECSEGDIIVDIDSYIEFSDMVHAHNQCFVIDKFSGIENISYIEKIRPDYIKINVSYILELKENKESVLNTLNILSKTMGIRLIITSIESEKQLSQLEKIGYENFQGIHMSKIVDYI